MVRLRHRPQMSNTSSVSGTPPVRLCGRLRHGPSLTKADRLRSTTRLMTHAMLFIGVDVVDGRPRQWRVENSWGEKAATGFWTMNDNWFGEHVFEVAVGETGSPTTSRRLDPSPSCSRHGTRWAHWPERSARWSTYPGTDRPAEASTLEKGPGADRIRRTGALRGGHPGSRRPGRAGITRLGRVLHRLSCLRWSSGSSPLGAARPSALGLGLHGGERLLDDGLPAPRHHVAPARSKLPQVRTELPLVLEQRRLAPIT